MRFLIITTLLLTGITSLVETSNARTLRFETWTTDSSNQDLNITPSGTGQVNIGGDGLVHAVKTTAQKNGISSPTEGQVVYDSDLETVSFRSSSAWVNLPTTAGTEVKSALVTDGSATTTVSEDNDNLINGNCTNTNDAGDYVCTFQNAYASAPHCWVSFSSAGAERKASVVTSTTAATIQIRNGVSGKNAWTISSTWNDSTEVNWTGSYMQIGEYYVFEGRGVIQGAVSSGALNITLPFTINTSGYGNADTESLSLGVASYHDTGAEVRASGQRVQYVNSTTIALFDGDGSNSGYSGSANSPITWATGDEIHFHSFPVPAASVDVGGPGSDANFRLFCKEQ